MVVNKKGKVIVWWGFILIILSLVVAYNFEGQIGGFFTFLIQLAGLTLILGSLINNFKIKKRFKVLLTIILTPAVYAIFFYIIYSIIT